MTRFVAVLVLLLTASTFCDARIRWVDKNGGLDPNGYQKYTTIQAAIDASVDKDTVRIAPGFYAEDIIIGKDIVVQGGGIFNTIITSSNTTHATVRMTNGKLMWIAISSSGHSGLDIQNATAVNCLFFGCNAAGVDCFGTNALVLNSISADNTGHGFSCGNGKSMTVINCISTRNNWGFCGPSTVKYSRTFANRGGGRCYEVKWTNSEETDPGLSKDGTYRTTTKNNGDPSTPDLDGTSPSTIGYYGGPDAALLPYVELPASIKLNTDGTIQFDMTGKVGY